MQKEMYKKIADTCNTPAFVFDIDELKDRVHMIQNTLGEDIRLCYAMKANPFLISELKDEIAAYEVCSPGEFQICEMNQIDMEQIVLSGVNKEGKDVQHVISTYEGKGVYTVESLNQLALLEACAAKANRTIHVLLRLTSGNQFGMDQEVIRTIVKERNEYAHLDIKGIQLYSGTQKKQLKKITKELDMLDTFITSLKADFDFVVEELEYGPGFYVAYFQGEEDVDDEELLGEFASLLQNMKFKGKLTLEMGRYIAAMCGYYFTKVIDQKCNCDENYAIVDGGINHLNYYGQMMAMKLPYYEHISESEEELESEEKDWCICGSLCTVGDVLIKKLNLRNLEINDILVFERIGAYSVTEGIYLFLSRDLPSIYFHTEKAGLELIRDRQSTAIINTKKRVEV